MLHSTGGCAQFITSSGLVRGRRVFVFMLANASRLLSGGYRMHRAQQRQCTLHCCHRL